MGKRVDMKYFVVAFVISVVLPAFGYLAFRIKAHMDNLPPD